MPWPLKLQRQAIISLIEGEKIGLGIDKNLMIQFQFNSLGQDSILILFNIHLNASISIQQ